MEISSGGTGYSIDVGDVVFSRQYKRLCFIAAMAERYLLIDCENGLVLDGSQNVDMEHFVKKFELQPVNAILQIGKF